MPRRRVTLVDIAKAAGVSHSTVSRVLNNRDYIAPATRELVQRHAVALGYEPNLAARRLAGGRLGLVGVLVPTLDSAYSLELLKNLYRSLATKGFELVLNVEDGYQPASQPLAYSSNRMVDGLITVEPNRHRVAMLAQSEIPNVHIGHEGDGVVGVTVDHRTGIAQAVQHLADLGHKRIAFLADPANNARARQLRAGYDDSVTANCLDADSALTRVVGPAAFDAAQAAQQLVALDLAPTAVVFASDETAAEAIGVFQEQGIGIPGRISVIGYGDMPVGRDRCRTHTTVAIPFAEIADRAVAALVQRLDEPDQITSSETISPKLIERSTTGVPPVVDAAVALESNDLCPPSLG